MPCNESYVRSENTVAPTGGPGGGERCTTTTTTTKRRKMVTSRASSKSSRSGPLLLLVPFAAILLLTLSHEGLGVSGQSLANSFFSEPDTQPGFVSRVGPRALSLLADYLGGRVEKFLKFGTLQYNITVPLTPLVRFSMSSAQTLHFDSAVFQSKMGIASPPSSLVSSPPTPPPPARGITWTGSGLRVTVNSIYKILSANGELTGQVPVTLDKAIIEMSLRSGVNSDGHMKTELERCRVVVGDLHLAFASGDVEVIRNYVPLIHRAIREQYDSLLCPTFISELAPVISNRLLNTPMSAALFDHYFINYGLIGPVSYLAEPLNTIELQHRGNVFGIIRQGKTRLNDFRLPFRSASLQVPPLLDAAQANKHMVTMYLSNYTLASLLFWMDQYRKFDYEISQKSVNDSNIAGYLRTECGVKDICAGTLFPALARSFPNGIVNIKTHTTAHPLVRFEKGKAFVAVISRIDAFVTQPDRTRRFLTATMYADLSLQKAHFHDHTLNAQLAIDSFKIADVVSLVEGLDAGSIEFLISALNELIIAEDMAKKLKEGVSLPVLLDFEQSSAEVHFEKDFMWIGVDYCFDENCKRGGEAIGGARRTSAGGGGGNETVAGGGDTGSGMQDADVNYYDATG